MHSNKYIDDEISRTCRILAHLMIETGNSKSCILYMKYCDIALHFRAKSTIKILQIQIDFCVKF